MRSYYFLSLISNKVPSKHYRCFLKFSYFYFFEKLDFPKLQSLVKMTQGILGVKVASIIHDQYVKFYFICSNKYCKSYEGLRDFSWNVEWPCNKKIALNNSFIQKNLVLLDRSILMKKTLICSIPIGEIKDIKSCVFWAIMALFEKKILWSAFLNSIPMIFKRNKLEWIMLLATTFSPL